MKNPIRHSRLGSKSDTTDSLNIAINPGLKTGVSNARPETSCKLEDS